MTDGETVAVNTDVVTGLPDTTHVDAEAADAADPERAGRAPRDGRPLVVCLAILAAASAVVGAAWIETIEAWTAVAAVVAWALAGVIVTWQRRDLPIGALAAALAAAGGAVLATSAAADGSDDATATVGRAIAIALVLALGAGLVLTAPDGRFADVSGRHRIATLAIVVMAIASAAGLIARRPEVPATVIITFAILSGAVAVSTVAQTCRRATAVQRARLQWFGWGGAITLTVAGVTWFVQLLTGWPTHAGALALAATVPAAAGVAASSVDRLLGVVARVLVHTLVALGLALFVAAVYLVTVLGLHGVPDESEGAVLALSLLAATIVAVLALPLRHRLVAIAERRVYGDGETPDRTLETFATRMSRAVPMDELVLQLAESLKRTMKLTAAEVWTGTDGTYDLGASAPSREGRRLTLDAEPLAVAARAHVQGNAWLAVWIPALLDGRGGASIRFTSVAHLGELLGFIVTERPADEAAVDDDDERRVLVDIARQLGLALHNVRLDTALQASLDELRAANRELVASRARIVAATDESRRRIERNLHDGAQQHLVALAVKVGLVDKLIDADPATARGMLGELRSDVQATLSELRQLAHGIYPPLLRDRGLPEALRTAAQRCPLPVVVHAEGLGRYGPELETAVYFCCLEAIQNAAKHAGDAATIQVSVRDDGVTLGFTVVDDGVGFTPGEQLGDGFVNMRDRLGAFDGLLDVASEPGLGTTVVGSVPLGSD